MSLPRSHVRKMRAHVVLLAAIALVVAAAFLPLRALAKDYAITSVDIDATVATDGSLSVTEDRIYDFDGSFHGVYWKIPKGKYEGKEVQVTIGEVGLVTDGSFKPFAMSSSGDDGTYTVTDYGDYLQVKLYSAHEDESATFRINYVDSQLARRYADTSELYWKFVSDGWDVESQNVRCVVHLPVPSGQTVSAGDNVRVWGHGPLDASVYVVDGNVVYSVPGVGSSEYAEARVAFPSEWLSDATASSEARLDYITSQEQGWADEANAKRAKARAISYGLSGFGGLAAIASCAYAISRRLRYKETHKPQFDDKYFRDVPSADHPAVLGALIKGGTPQQEDLTASLMRLTDLGMAKLSMVKTSRKGLFGRTHQDSEYRLELTPNNVGRSIARTKGPGEAQARRIDEDTIKFLFRKIAPKGTRSDSTTLYFSEIGDVAKSDAETYRDAYEDWETTVEACLTERRFSEDEHSNGRVGLALFGGIDVILAVGLAFLMLIGEVAGTWGLPAAVLLAVAGVFSIWSARGMESLSSEAIELKAKLEALRRWLLDFTRLEEAIPQDVVLWNQLLVLAVVLGVSEEVIKQLKIAAPQILEDPQIMPVYGWYHTEPGLGRPVADFGENISHAHQVSTAELASSSFSDGGGGGGGFSGGGGGGFGGGGGGGAF